MAASRPLNIGRFLVSPKGSRVYGLAVEARIKKGALRRLSQLAEEAEVVIRYLIYSTSRVDDEYVRAVALLDFSEAKVSPEELLRRVSQLELVREARLIYPVMDGLICDDFFPLLVGEEKAVIFREAVYAAIIKGVRERFGSAGEALLYHQGLLMGQNAYQGHVKVAGSDRPERVLEVMKVRWRAVGWGVIDEVNLNLKERKATVRVSSCFECELGRGSGRPYAQLTRGSLAGTFMGIFKGEVACQEVKCIAKGDPHCEFHVEAKGK